MWILDRSDLNTFACELFICVAMVADLFAYVILRTDLSECLFKLINLAGYVNAVQRLVNGESRPLIEKHEQNVTYRCYVQQ